MTGYPQAPVTGAGLVRFLANARRKRITPELASWAKAEIAKLGLPDGLEATMFEQIDQCTIASGGSRRTMIDEVADFEVVDWLLCKSKRPKLAVKVWAAMKMAVRNHRGELAVTRGDLAELCGCHANHVSEVISTLVEYGAVLRDERHRGMYRVNTGLAARGPLEAIASVRDKPPLTVISGGRKPVGPWPMPE